MIGRHQSASRKNFCSVFASPRESKIGSSRPQKLTREEKKVRRARTLRTMKRNERRRRRKERDSEIDKRQAFYRSRGWAD